jgi:hypothetical protein
MTAIEQAPNDPTPLPTNEQVVRALDRKLEMVKDAWRNIKEAEEGCMQTDWIFVRC